MAKLYVFGIGGTGSRVIKSLAMLLASGVRLGNNFNTVVPIIIDPDVANGDLSRTIGILKLYKKIRDRIDNPDDFFGQELTSLGQIANNNSNDENFHLRLDDGEKTEGFEAYIAYNTTPENDKHFIELLYSKTNLSSDLKFGFEGNPNMGAVVLNQFVNSQAFQTFATTFDEGDAIFIINSIFGGTGAAGFPLLLKNLRGNQNLPNYQQIKNARIGAITYLPYFRLNQRDEINSESFIERAKNAIVYYNRTIIAKNQINTLYFIGDGGSDNIQQYAVGGNEQKNSANFLELAGALAILDFCQGNAGNTTIKEFGIQRNPDYLSFGDLNDSQKNLIEKPLSKFWLFAKYLLSGSKGLAKSLGVSRWTRSNIKFVPQQKQSPCDKSYFNSSEYINDVKKFITYFDEWMKELSEKYPKFSPFQGEIPDELFKQIDLHNCLNIDDLSLRPKSGQDSKVHTTLIKLFSRSTEIAYQYKNIMSNQVIRKNDGGQSKVFRIHEGAAGTGWFSTGLINAEVLEKVETDGKFVANSIPSPFARLDLFKSAFQWINHKIMNVVAQQSLKENEKRKSIKGICDADTAYNKLISEVFDIAELFYRSQSLRDKIQIIDWNPRERINALIDGYQEHKHFAETLKLFWEQDSVQNGNKVLYNFEHFNLNPDQAQNQINPPQLYFVVNRAEKKVIGGTSPITLFFSAPDADSAVGNIKINNRQPIKDFLPLHKRDPEFILYIYAFARQQDNFANLFPEVNGYLNHVKEYCLEENLRSSVNRLQENELKEVCTVTDNPNERCNVLGFNIGLEKPVFSEKIIKLPYPIDSDRFKTCNPFNNQQKGAEYYLLPLTAEFIRKRNINIQDIVVRIENLAAGGAQVKLTLNDVEYKQTYQNNNIIQPRIHIAILPFLKNQNEQNQKYIVGVLDDRDNRDKELSLQFFKDNTDTPINVEAPVVRNNGADGTAKSMYYKVPSTFNYIQIQIGDAKGLIIPKFQQAGGNQELSFAVDVGTTNTHIEYRVEQGMQEAFSVNQNQPLWQSLMRRSNIDDVPNINVIKAVLGTFDKEMIPYKIGAEDSTAKFPLRTAIVFNSNNTSNNTINQNYRLFQDVNNYLLYERQVVPQYLQFDTQIKWSNYQNEDQKYKVKAYIEYLLTIIYYKALLLGGNPQNTKIYWFYPVSMTQFEQQTYTQLWKQAYQRVFGINNNNLISIPESVAPYLYYRTTEIVGRSLLIDIGGGSSDIAVFTQQGQGNATIPDFISSFKFAGNTIFGNGYFADDINRNGWVRSFNTENNRQTINQLERGEILKDLLKRNNPVDFSNFLFGLENLGIFNYSEQIRHHPIKLTILIFYAAIAFYSAKLLKKSNIEIPTETNILLSGNTSRTVRILDVTPNCQHISSLFRHIFQHVYEQNIQAMNFRIADNPKEITCKGALSREGALLAGHNNYNNIAVNFWLGGSQGQWGEAINKRNNEQTPTYNQISNENKEDVCNSISEFYDVLDGYAKNLNDSFGIQSAAYEVFKKIRNKKIQDYLNRYMENTNRENNIEETLFFAPLVGILPELAYELSK